jgi:hypothetical protein
MAAPSPPSGFPTVTAAGIRRDIQTGILKCVSVGYQANYREFIQNGNRVREAASIVPREISVTPLGADPQAPMAFADNLIQTTSPTRAAPSSRRPRAVFRASITGRPPW